MRRQRVAFQAIGTAWVIETRSELSTAAWQRLEAAIHARIEQFDMAYSRFRSDSLVSQMATHQGNFKVPDDAHQLLKFYEDLYKVTEGSVTPLIGQVVSDAGYDAQYSLQTKPLRQPPHWEEVLSYTKTSITLTQPALLDFGAAGKGYLVDIVGRLLRDAGLKNYTINAGGDMQHKTNTDDVLIVGLENPYDTSEVLGTVTLKNQSLCASAGSRRKWGDYHHIIDPNSLQSPLEIAAVWVIASDTMSADGLATALFFTKPTMLQKHFQFAYALLRRDMSLERSRNFPLHAFEAVQ